MSLDIKPLKEKKRDPGIKVSKLVFDEIRKARGEKDEGIRGTKMASSLKNSTEDVVYVIPSSSPRINKLFGGGLPNGFTELYAEEGNYKSTLAYDFIKHAQKLGLATLILETESSIHQDNVTMLEDIGIDLDNLVIKKIKIVEDGFEYVDNFVQKAKELGLKAFVVIDSLGNMASRKEIERGYDSSKGLPERAKAINYAVRIFSNTVEDCEATVLIINHAHDGMKIGGPASRFPQPKTSPGGKFLKFVCRIRAISKKCDKIKKGSKTIGINVRLTTTKNKITKDGENCIVPIIPGQGIMMIRETTELAYEIGIAVKRGNTVTYQESKFTIDEFESRLESDKKFYREVRAQIKQEFV